MSSEDEGYEDKGFEDKGYEDKGCDEGYLGFVGVTTGSSSIMRIFPVWAELLDLPVRRIVGHDLPVDAPAEDYRTLVEQIRDDPRHWGALVTTHKMNLYRACQDLFADVDEFGRAAGEVSSISKRPLPPAVGASLHAHAKDAVTVGLALDEFLPPGHFARGGHVLILGAGGAGTALSHHLVHRPDAPERIIVTAVREDDLAHLRDLHDRTGTPSDLVETVLVDPAGERTAELMAALPPGSLVVNATGLGKDRPGSPVPETAAFPQDGIVWEFNYRGSLEFWHQATAQEAERGLTVVDGWRYFIHGWTSVISEVFDVQIDQAELDRLSEAAQRA